MTEPEKHIYKTALIGNCSYLAHVNLNTNIDWLCWPRFDSDFVFGGMLDHEKGGKFTIQPEGVDFKSSQSYLENSNVLETVVDSEIGSYKIIDFAPRFEQYERYFKPLMLIRKVIPISGSPTLRVCLKGRKDRGAAALKAVPGSNHIAFKGKDQEVRLTTTASLSHILNEQPFVLNETHYFVLTYGSDFDAPLIDTCEHFLLQTNKYWRNWVKSTGISGFHQPHVLRSALVLKIHQYEDTGGIIAASTTSLPESPGAGRNWDYRYCWIRDTYYTLNAFNNIGHFEESQKYFQYIGNLTLTKEGRYQPLYSIVGNAQLIEEKLDLKGYLGNQPVHFGNDAYTHIQNDVYGQVLVSLLPLYADKRIIEQEKEHSKRIINNLLDKIDLTMDEPDAGLWEFRNIAQKHCYTFLFHWAGACSAIKIADHLEDPAMKKRAEKLKQQAIDKIEACYSPTKKAYTQAIGTENMDASTLQLITMNYLDPNSDRAKDHLRALEKELKTEEGLFYRYRHADDFGEPETTFLICSFWYVEALACVGRVDEAILHFEQLIGYGNHVKLLSEDVDAQTGSQWGNFPQAYSHVGLMNAAFRISRKLDQPNFL
ncbi:MAG: glycoside hydrolase family 15 protein [Cyclobacteriaceae bacterium]|nr:glycoside hydrolase family 15 protein [Cyclobacteriaceae bacterium]MCH8515938.1 glycoside hydrolase family 15 protein [Cyclobacteriaceae bacterium]